MRRSGVQTAPLKQGREVHAYLQAPRRPGAKPRPQHALPIGAPSQRSPGRALIGRRRDGAIDARREPGEMASRAYDVVLRADDSRTQSTRLPRVQSTVQLPVQLLL